MNTHFSLSVEVETSQENPCPVDEHSGPVPCPHLLHRDEFQVFQSVASYNSKQLTYTVHHFCPAQQCLYRDLIRRDGHICPASNTELNSDWLIFLSCQYISGLTLFTFTL